MVTAKAEGFTSSTKNCMVGYDMGPRSTTYAQQNQPGQDQRDHGEVRRKAARQPASQAVEAAGAEETTAGDLPALGVMPWTPAGINHLGCSSIEDSLFVVFSVIHEGLGVCVHCKAGPSRGLRMFLCSHLSK